METQEDTQNIAFLPTPDRGIDEIKNNISDNVNFNSIDNSIKSPNGEIFNPDIHLGTDRINKDGSFKRKRTRKNEDSEDTEKSQALSHTIVFGFSTAGQVIFGEEFKPDKNEEKYLFDSLNEYLNEKGVSDLPPSIALIIAFGGFTLGRLSRKSCRENLIKKFEKIKLNLGKKDAHSNSRDNGNGENNPR